jgi:hypothetical protein
MVLNPIDLNLWYNDLPAPSVASSAFHWATKELFEVFPRLVIETYIPLGMLSMKSIARFLPTASV